MAHFHQLATDRSRLTTADGSGRPSRSIRLVHGSVPPISGQVSPAPFITDPRRLAAHLAQAIAEVVARARQAGQLEGLLTTESSRALRRAMERSQTRTGGQVRRPTVASVRLATPRAGVIEACAVIDAGVRKRALAFRLELTAGHWVCTALRIG